MPRATVTDDNPVRRLRGEAVEPIGGGAALAGAPGGPGSMATVDGLPSDCPVVPLGHKNTDLFFFLTADRSYKVLRDERFTQNKFFAMYGGNTMYLEATWPRVGDKGIVTGIDTNALYAAHMAAAIAAGPWDPSNRLRETGAWREPDGTLVLHCGTTLYAKQLSGAETQHPPGLFGDHVYSKCPATPTPWPEKVKTEAAEKLLKAFGTFAWRSPEIDARLLLGWCVAALMGGALKWRPLIWITGDKGTGKSTLQDLLQNLMGGALVHASDTTAAGIYQALKLSTRPVTIDEMEAQQDNRKPDAVIKLARQASSGGLVLRGGQEHQGVEFQARSCFLFSSINHPPLEGQDLSRIAILELGLWEGKSHGLGEDALHTIGRKLMRRIIDGWPKFGERFAAWFNGLKRIKNSARDADQYGTLLACADLVLSDRIPDADTVDEEIATIGLDRLTERNADVPDHEKMRTYLLTEQLDISRGNVKVSAARLLEIFLGRVPAMTDQARDDAERDLQSIGLKPFFHDKTWWLAIASNHQGLARIFEGSHWRGKSGTAGVWVQAARRVPGARPHGVPLRFNGVSCRVTLMPMDAVMPLEPSPLADPEQPA